MFATIRAVHLAQAAVCLAKGRDVYRRPRLVGATLALLAGEFIVLCRRWSRQGGMDEVGALVDTAFGVVGLMAVAAGTQVEDLTTSMNWALPASVGATACIGATMSPRRSALAAGALATTYGLSVRRSFAGGQARSTTAAANVVSYGGFLAVVRICTALVVTSASELDELRSQAVERSARLATERERNNQHRLLHDSALQALEAVAAGWDAHDPTVRAAAVREALRLRRALQGEELDATTMDMMLASLVAEFDTLRIELVVEPLENEPRVEVREALCDATREALRNVVRHAGVSTAVVRCALSDDGVEVTVRDHGCGFDVSSTRRGFGTSSSIVARVVDQGGRAVIWSQPGHGTRVRTWGPLP